MQAQRTQGLCIACEGIDGSGKTTVISHLVHALEQAGISVLATREPGGTPVGKDIRHVLMQHAQIDADAEFLLFAADRAHHYRTCIAPALSEGRVVITDRFAASSYAYLGYGRGVSCDFIDTVHEHILGGWMPDMTIYLRVSPETAAQRRAHRLDSNRFDTAECAWFARVIEGFDAWAAREKQVYIVDAEQSARDVLENVVALVRTHTTLLA